MEKIAILDAATVGETSIFEPFKKFGKVRLYETTATNERLQHIDDATIILTNKVVIDAPIIDACPHIKLICVLATGTNNIDIPYAQSKGITVKNVAGYSTESVVQHTFAILLSLLQHCEYYSNFVHTFYSQQPLFTHIGEGYMELQGRTWGIIGLGAIGKRVAEVATAFHCKVVYYSTSGNNHNTDYQECSLEELLQQSDVISIHAPLNEKTYGLIGYDELAMMKPTAYIVNVGRGGIIQENALAQILQENRIAGACLDVMEHEPLPQNSPLLDTSIQHKLLITPHVAWIGDKARKTLIEKTIENVENEIKDKI